MTSSHNRYVSMCAQFICVGFLQYRTSYMVVINNVEMKKTKRCFIIMICLLSINLLAFSKKIHEINTNDTVHSSANPTWLFDVTISLTGPVIQNLSPYLTKKTFFSVSQEHLLYCVVELRPPVHALDVVVRTNLQ